MEKPLYNDQGRIVTADGKMVDYIKSEWDVRRWMYPLYVPDGHVVCPECKGNGVACRSFWDWLIGRVPDCYVCHGQRTFNRLGPLPPPPPPKKTCRHCGCNP